MIGWRRAALIGALAGCSSSNEIDKVGEAGDHIEGTVIVDGMPATPTGCRAARAERVYVDIATSHGTLRYRDTKLYWNGVELSCHKLDRKWQGGGRPDGTAYWKGMFDVVCESPYRLTAKLELECGRLTAEERALSATW